jgi:HK97 family phage portal protein
VNIKAFVGAPGRGLRALTRMVWSRTVAWGWSLRRLSGTYWKEVGDGTNSSTVAAPLLWAARTFPEAPPALWRLPEGDDEGAEDRLVRKHELLRRLQRPNSVFTGPELWMATITEYMALGEAFWLKIRSRSRAVVELWWVPVAMMTPRSDDDETLIAYYEYSPGDGQTFRVAVEDVVHFRFGIDSEDPRRGASPLKSVLREVFTDDEASRFTASLLVNSGVPGLVISPEQGVTISQADADATKEYVKSEWTGDRRGDPLVLSGPTKVHQFGFSPEQMTLRELRRIPEERVTAVLGIPAIVAGLGAGLDRSTFTNMAEAREAAYEAGIIPMQRILAEKVRFDLLPDFGEDPFDWRFGFDLSKVRVLQDDEDKLWSRLDKAVRGGWATVAYAKRKTGQPVLPGDEVYLRNGALVQVPAAGGDPQPLQPPRDRSGETRELEQRLSAEIREVGREVRGGREQLALSAGASASVDLLAVQTTMLAAATNDVRGLTAMVGQLVAAVAQANEHSDQLTEKALASVERAAEMLQARPDLEDAGLEEALGRLAEATERATELAERPRRKSIEWSDGRTAEVVDEPVPVEA